MRKSDREKERERERRGNVKKNEIKDVSTSANYLTSTKIEPSTVTNKQTNHRFTHSQYYFSFPLPPVLCERERSFCVYLRLFVFTDSRKERQHTHTRSLIGHFLLTFSWCLSYIYLYSFILSIKDEYILISPSLTSVYHR